MRPTHASARGNWMVRPCVVLLTLAFCTLVSVSTALAQAPAPGVAQGFEVDGNLICTDPSASAKHDWLDGPSSSGSGLLNPDPLGTPRNPSVTFHFRDLVGSDANMFSESAKVIHDPNTYTWKAGTVPSKDDIQNGLIHFFKDANGDYWFVVGGDRQSINGDSYIDFEFLQGSLRQNDDGTFTSSGPHGGRTLGDVLLTIKLTNGGSLAEFYAQEWVEDRKAGYIYADMRFPKGSAFVASNVDSSVCTTYDAFGTNVYSINQFGEAAVNLNALLPDFDACTPVTTVFIRTKSSSSMDASLKDFITPFELSLCLDDEPPVIDCPAEITLSCDQSLQPTSVGLPLATDNCDSDVEVNFTDEMVPGQCPNHYTVLRTWVATDECGNTTECVQTLNVVDDAPPVVLSGPADTSVECIEEVPAANPSLINATDACGSVDIVHVGDASDGNACPRVITRTYRVTDDCGLTTDWVQTITVDDVTPPQVTALDDFTIECIDELPPANTTLVSATDNCGGVSVAFVSDQSDGASCPETITRTYRVTDECGNFTDVTRTIRVMDLTPPQINGPADLTVDCVAEVPPSDVDLINASDNCANVQVEHTGDAPDGNSCPLTIRRTYRATDDCGNSAEFTQMITVDDRTPPELAGPADATVSCIEEVPLPDTGLLTASDNCGDVTLDHVVDVSDGNSCPQTITRTYRATDDCGNFTEYSQVFTIDDKTPPELVGPEDVTVECIDEVPPADVRLVTASDNCGNVAVTHISDISDDNTCEETITRTYRATDDCGNFTEFTQHITIKDTTPPVLYNAPLPMYVQCIEDIPAPAPDGVEARDNCSEVRVEHVGDESNGKTCPEVVYRRYRVFDACDNYTDYVQMIAVDDNTPPTLSVCPDDKYVECPSGIVFDTPTAKDNCDAEPSVVVIEDFPILLPEPWTYSVTRTWQAVDNCDNVSGTCTQTITFHCEVDALGTFTQGFYGNWGGHFNGFTTIEIIQGALAQGPLVCGLDGRSLKIKYESAHCIIERLPAGVTPSVLPYTGNSTVQPDDCRAHPKQVPLDSEGKYENVLLGQTITLALNMRFSPMLFLFPLSPVFCTHKAHPGPDGMYGTDDDYPDPDYQVQAFHIPQSVLDAIDTLGLWMTVQGILDLCNRGLAGEDTAGATLAEITAAADAINKGFDQWRFIVDCPTPDNERGDGHDLFTSAGNGQEPDDGPASGLPSIYRLEQNYPNPFNPSTRIPLSVPEATTWSIGVFNVEGQLLRRYSGSTSGPAVVDVEWDGKDAQGKPVATGVYFYRAKAGTFSAVRRMVLLK